MNQTSILSKPIIGLEAVILRCRLETLLSHNKTNVFQLMPKRLKSTTISHVPLITCHISDGPGQLIGLGYQITAKKEYIIRHDRIWKYIHCHVYSNYGIGSWIHDTNRDNCSLSSHMFVTMNYISL